MGVPAHCTGRSPVTYTWPMNSLRGVVRATLALAVAVSVGLAGCATPTPTPFREPAESPPPSEPAAAGVDLGDIAWVYTPPASPLGGPEGAFTLQAGTLADDEPIVNLRVPWRAELGGAVAREPAIGAPHRGAVVYVADDGAGSEVHRVEIAAGGADEVLASLDDLIWDIVVAPDESAAYAVVVDRADPTRDLGVVRILLDGSGSVESILAPAQAGAADPVRSVAVLAFQIDLAISSDGRHLVRRTCQEAGACVVEVVDVATGRRLDLPDREVLGVADGVIVARGCDVHGCRVEAMDFATGATRSGDIDVSGPVVEVGGKPVIVAVVSDGRGTVTVEAVEPLSGRRSVLHRVPDGTDVAYGDFLFLQMDLPAGFVHVIEMTAVGDGGAVMGMDARHFLISVVEKRAVEIPAPAFSDPPGIGTQG